MDGSVLTNRKINNMKNPIVPAYVMTSHFVGMYMPHDDGKKSR